MASSAQLLHRCVLSLKYGGSSLRRALFSTGESSTANVSSEFKIPPIFQSGSALRSGSNQNSNSKLTVKPQLPEFSGFIPVEKLEIRYSRSSGPGGQHVNRTNSKVEVRFNIQQADWLPEWIRQRLALREASKLTSEGVLIVSSDRTRKQILNQADCIDKIRRMIIEASRLPKEPTPEEVALRERRQKLAQQRRLADRRHHSQIKQSRQAPSASDD